MNFVYVLDTVSLLLRYISVILIIPCIAAVLLKEYPFAVPFFCAGIISFCFGFLFKQKNRNEDDINNLNKTEAFAIVILTWLLMCLLGTIPFMYFGLNFIDSLFESVSGITSTGATILDDFSRYPQVMFFWRSFSQWLGGMGIIVLFTAVLPQFSIAGRRMFFAEVPGAKENKLTPRIRQTAVALWGIYFALTLAETVILILMGMPVFDSICTAFSTVSGGGFSPKSQSIIAYGQAKYIQTIAVFMFFTGINFALQYKVFAKGKILSVFKDEEFRAYFFTVIVFTLLTAFVLYGYKIYDLFSALQESLFQVLAIISTTGFSSSDYSTWPLRAKLLLFVLMFSGASIGSASGGLKILRLIIILKYMKRQVAQILHPNGVYLVKINKLIIGEDVLRQIISFVFFYYGIFVVSALIMTFIEKDVITGVTASIATLGNIGPGFGSVIGVTGNYGDLHFISKLISILNMFAGRLELIPFLALLHPDFWNFKKSDLH